MATTTEMKGLFNTLMKSPSQARDEQNQRVIQNSLANSQAMISNGGTTALPGIISRYGAQAAQRGAQAGAGLLRGVSGGVGSAVGGEFGESIGNLGISAAERQAIAERDALEGVSFENPESIKAAADKIRSVNPRTAALLDAKAVEAQAALDEAARKKAELDIKQGKLKVEQNKEDRESKETNLNKLLGITLKQYSPESQQAVAKAYNDGKLPKESDKEFKNRLTSMLQEKPKESKATNVLVGGKIVIGQEVDGNIFITDSNGKRVPAPKDAQLASNSVRQDGTPTLPMLKAASFIVQSSPEYKELNTGFLSSIFSSGDIEKDQNKLLTAFAQKLTDRDLSEVPYSNLITEVYLQQFDRDNIKELKINGVVYLADMRPLKNNNNPNVLRRK